MLDAIPSKVEHLDDDYTWVESEREYVEAVDGLEFNYEYGDYYRHVERKRVNLYLDPATGLVVFDVQAYEKWLAGR